MTQAEFIAMLKPGATKAYRTCGLLPSIMIAQSAVETGWGSHIRGNNLFCIIWTPGCGFEPLGVLTDEGEILFRKYDSYEASINDYINLMQTAHYKDVLKAKDYQEAAVALQLAGYAGITDKYAPLLMQIIEENNLWAIDEEVRPYTYDEVDKAIAYLIAKGELLDIERTKQTLHFWIGIHYIYIKWANSLRKREDV
jgi:flagellum-specific peptidoglycan hydrolase FlgJ